MQAKKCMPCNYFSVFKQMDFPHFGIYGYEIIITSACSIKSSLPNHTSKEFYKSYTFNSIPLNYVIIIPLCQVINVVSTILFCLYTA